MGYKLPVGSSLGLILMILILIVSWGIGVQAQEQVIFEQDDPVGDEYGPGTYIYPTSEQFKPYEGLFDLQNYKVSRQAEQYHFYFQFVEITNPWQAPYGFSHQLIQVYIDNQSGGQLTTLQPGANVEFEEQHPWNQMLKITGWQVELYSTADEPDQETSLDQAKVKVDEQAGTVKVSLPQNKLTDLADAHYYVLVGSLDGFGYDNYRQVAAEPSGWKFGGGSDTDINPNLLDTLVPEGLDQKEVLAAYDLETEQLATLRAVGPELSLPVKFLTIVGFSLVVLFSLVGAVVKLIGRRRDS